MYNYIMKKKVNWDTIYSNPIQKNMGQQGKYSSGREMLSKAMEREQEQRDAENMLRKAMPAMQALLKCRLENKTPLQVRRPLNYIANEIVHMRIDPYDDNSEIMNSSFKDVRKSLNPGTELVLKSLDPHLQEFIFEDQNGNEVVLPYTMSTNLMTSTNIYEDVKKFIDNQGE